LRAGQQNYMFVPLILKPDQIEISSAGDGNGLKTRK
jgi:hypothetical protein